MNSSTARTRSLVPTKSSLGHRTQALVAIAATALVACSQPTEPPVDAATADSTSDSDASIATWGIVAKLATPAPSAVGCRIQGRTKVDDAWVDAWMCPEFQQTFIEHDTATILAETATPTSLPIKAGGNPCVSGDWVRISEWRGVVSIPRKSANEPSRMGPPIGRPAKELDSFVCEQSSVIVAIDDFNVVPQAGMPNATLVEIEMVGGAVVQTWPRLSTKEDHLRVFSLDALAAGPIAFSGVRIANQGDFSRRPYVGVAERDGSFRWNHLLDSAGLGTNEGMASSIVWTDDGKLYVAVVVVPQGLKGSARLVRLDPASGQALLDVAIAGTIPMSQPLPAYSGGIRLWRRAPGGLLATRLSEDAAGTNLWNAEVLAFDGATTLLTTTPLPTFQSPHASSPAPSNIDGEYVDIAWGTSVYRLRLPLGP